jgi:hypothetical protein
MKKLFALLCACSALPALAADQIITVTFDSVAATPTKSGETLDKTMFSFGPAVPGAVEDTSAASSNGLGKSKEEACRWALLGSLIKIEAKAKQSGKKVVGVRTYAGATEGATKDNLVCLAGAMVVRSTVKVGYK